MTGLDERARQILKKNDRGGYTIPTDGLYPYQWNWDSAFAALGFASFDLERAWTELETLFSGQWANGMVPHILFHKPDPGYFPGPDVWGTDGPVASSGITQPPVAATVARLIFERDNDVGRPHLEALYPKLLDWHRWFMSWRLDHGAVCITHPWEAGRDNAPDWDGAMAAIDPVGVGSYTRRDTGHVDPSMRPTKEDYDRYIWLVQRARTLDWNEADMLSGTPFRVADPTMTFVLLRAMRDLKAIAGILDKDQSELDAWVSTLTSGAETLWNPHIRSYDALDTRTRLFAGSVSNASFLCWYAGCGNADMITHFDRVAETCRFMVPSYDPSGPKFEAMRYWRGPVWAIMNFMIGLGLSDVSPSRSQIVRKSTAKLIEENGFAEYFDPLAGTPAGGGSFTWTAAVWLAWAGPEGWVHSLEDKPGEY